MERQDSRTLIRCREDLQHARRIVVKAGTSVVCNPDGRLNLSRLSSIVEQLSDFIHQGYEMILVTSGAVGCGRQLLRRQAFLTGSFREKLRSPKATPLPTDGYNSACASAGQLGLMSFYDTLFDQCDVAAAQFLVTSYDFTEDSRKNHLTHSMNEIISHGMIPVINENDASTTLGYTEENVFTDNDALAAIVAVELKADALLLLTDVEGLYDKPPSEHGAQVITEYFTEDPPESFKVGNKSAQGRGGMGAKVDSAIRALERGVPGVVIASGYKHGAMVDILKGKSRGTLFVNGTNPFPEKPLRARTQGCRDAARILQALSSEERERILNGVAQALRDSSAAILAVNAQDISNAEAAGLSGQIMKRLKLSEEKLETLSNGIESIAKQPEPIGQMVEKRELADGLILSKVTVPIGVMLVIFESRPDSLPQIASLAIRSGNGLLLKGGKEAEMSNRILHKVITDAIDFHSGGKVCGGDLIQIFSSRDEVGSLLSLHEDIDLVIPRGGKSLVEFVNSNTRIPVLSHADGICHVFVDKDADVTKAMEIVVDSKTDYPAACNAAETVLFHEDTPVECRDAVLQALRDAGVTIKGGPRAVELGIIDESAAAESLSVEYGDLTICVEIVKDCSAAIDHIHEHGSSHTETIVTENEDTSQCFTKAVDSACVFHNASTRFSDGYRFGLGAEVGISTGRLHARGPVGVEGLLSRKWVLESNSTHSTVAQFSGPKQTRSFTHRELEF